MPEPTPETLSVGRRGHPRLRLGVPARLITLEGAQKIVLDDLSRTGAQITIVDEGPFSKGFLSWLDFEVFAELAWQDGLSCGLRFDEPLEEQSVVETRRQAPGMLDLQKRLRQMAKNWTQGAPDW